MSAEADRPKPRLPKKRYSILVPQAARRAVRAHRRPAPRIHKSAIVEDALDRRLNPEKYPLIGDALLRRLDEQSRSIATLKRETVIVAKMLSLFVRNYPKRPRTTADVADCDAERIRVAWCGYAWVRTVRHMAARDHLDGRAATQLADRGQTADHGRGVGAWCPPLRLWPTATAFAGHCSTHGCDWRATTRCRASQSRRSRPTSVAADVIGRSSQRPGRARDRRFRHLQC